MKTAQEYIAKTLPLQQTAFSRTFPLEARTLLEEMECLLLILQQTVGDLDLTQRIHKSAALFLNLAKNNDWIYATELARELEKTFKQACTGKIFLNGQILHLAHAAISQIRLLLDDSLKNNVENNSLCIVRGVLLQEW
ncbi:MAG: hypothetical protein H7832_00155 [Magnetococcus sp. DMHC-6]